MNRPTIRSIGIACLAVAALSASVLGTAAAAADAYPTKAIRVIAPAPAGGGTDFLARLIGMKITQKTTQPVVVENITGANGNIGAAQVARASPDGYTLLMSYVGTQAINPSLYRTMPYNPLTDLEPIMRVADYPLVITVNESLPVNSLKEFIEYAKTHRVNYGSAGVGSGGHMFAVQFAKAYGVDMTHVPFRGSAPAMTALLSNDIQVEFDTLSTLGPSIKAGKLKALAMTSDTRVTNYPDIPTVVEVGYPKLVYTGWYGLFAPKATPGPVRDAIAKEVADVMLTKEYQDKIVANGYLVIRPQTPLAYKTFVETETRRYAELVRLSGASME